MTETIPTADVVAANPGPAVHLAALGILVLIALVVYAVVRWRRRNEAVGRDGQPHADDASSRRQT